MLYHHDYIAERLEDEDRVHLSLYKLLKQDMPPQEHHKLWEQFKDREFYFDSMVKHSFSGPVFDIHTAIARNTTLNLPDNPKRWRSRHAERHHGPPLDLSIIQ